MVLRYHGRAVLRPRLFATALASALLLMPSMRGVRDSAPLLPGAAAAETGAPAAADDDDDGATAPEPAEGRSPDRPAAAALPPAPAPVAFGFGPRTGFQPSTGPRELVLSFDDGPDLKFTPLVLEELDRRGLKAIFFITGHRLVGDRPEDVARRDLVRKISAHGHLVANHTMTHRNLCRFPSEAAAEIDGNSEVIAASTGVRPLLFRAPYGARCRVLEAALVERQLTSVGWNLDPQDWKKGGDSADVLRYLVTKLGRLEGRGILLLHDTHAASVFALGPLLDWIARENRRATADGRPPIQLRDYSVFLPETPLPTTGLGTLAAGIARELPWLPAPAAGTATATTATARAKTRTGTVGVGGLLALLGR